MDDIQRQAALLAADEADGDHVDAQAAQEAQARFAALTAEVRAPGIYCGDGGWWRGAVEGPGAFVVTVVLTVA